MTLGAWQRRSWASGLLFVLLALLLVTVPRAEARGPGLLQQGVASESPTAARDAMTVLNRGGTAADAAIVAALVAGVTAPTSSGIGGGGFVVGWDAEKKTPYVIDFRETAPAGLEREAFERQPSPPERLGHLVGVPGEVRGLFELHQNHGKLPWSSLVQMAEDRATRGFSLSRHAAGMLAWARERLVEVPGFSGLFFPGGRPAAVGVRLTNPALGRTLNKISRLGPAGFYSGTVAEDIVKTVQKHGGTMTLEDLASYQVEHREPLRVRYASLDVYTMPPPSAGGLLLVQILQLFPPETLRQLGHGTPAYQHLLAEGMRGAIADRARYIGDPKFAKFDLPRLLSEERMHARRGKIALDRSHALPRFGLEEHGTHHLVTADRQGNMIALTTTVNRLFGSKLHAESSGVVLNDELADFTTDDTVEAYGMQQSPNRPRPGARPVSSMTPTIAVRNGQPVLALGGSGGTAIATNVTQVFLASAVFDHSAQAAVTADRIYIPPDGYPFMQVEKGTSEAHKDDLRWRGEIVGEVPYSTTGVQLLRQGPGGLEAAADPRKHGLGIAY